MKKAILLGITIAFLLSAIGVSASCVVPTDGMIITSNTWFCHGSYYLPNGIEIRANDVFLDCNNSTLTGNSSEVGIRIWPGPSPGPVITHISVTNCTIENYYMGISNGNSDASHIYNNYVKNCSDGIDIFGVNSVIYNNTIENTLYSIRLIVSTNNIVANNIVKNCRKETFGGNLSITLEYALEGFGSDQRFVPTISSVNNKIYNNTVHCSIYTSYPVIYNEFCVNGIGNTYLDGATGPTCPASLESRVSALESLVNGLQSLVQSIQDMLNKIIGCTGTQTCVSGGNCTAGCPGGCQSNCVGSVRYFNGNCNLTSCGCSFSTEDCNLKNNWYNTTSTRWVNATSNTEKEQLQQEFRDYGCQPAACTYSVNNTRWIDTGATRNKTIVMYCPVKTGFSTYLWITNVSLNGNSKASDSSTYSDFTNATLTNLTVGNNYTLYVSASSTMFATSFAKAWIDFDNDGNFSTGEEVNLGNATFAGSRTFSKNFTVPISATAGETRMRVYITYNSAPSPCVSATYGEIEDYKINIRSQNAINQQGEGSGNTTSGSGNNGTVNNVTLATVNP